MSDFKCFQVGYDGGGFVEVEFCCELKLVGCKWNGGGYCYFLRCQVIDYGVS